MTLRKRMRILMLFVVIIIMAFMLFMHYIRLNNGVFIFCVSAALMFGSISIYTQISRNEIKKYLSDYYKGDTKRAEEYYRYQMFFTKALFVVTALLLLIGISSLF